MNQTSVTLGIAALLTIGGCDEAPAEGSDASATDLADSEDSGGSPRESQLQVHSWWIHNGESAALDALLSAYLSDHPDVTIRLETPSTGVDRGFAELGTRFTGWHAPVLLSASFLWSSAMGRPGRSR